MYKYFRMLFSILLLYGSTEYLSVICTHSLGQNEYWILTSTFKLKILIFLEFAKKSVIMKLLKSLTWIDFLRRLEGMKRCFNLNESKWEQNSVYGKQLTVNIKQRSEYGGETFLFRGFADRKIISMLTYSKRKLDMNDLNV